jgi:hypothetical protein
MRRRAGHRIVLFIKQFRRRVQFQLRGFELILEFIRRKLGWAYRGFL